MTEIVSVLRTIQDLIVMLLGLGVLWFCIWVSRGKP